MADGVDARRLFDDDDMLVQMADDQVFGECLGQPFGPAEHFDGVARLEPPGGVEAQLAVDLHAPAVDNLLDLPPRLPRQESGARPRASAPACRIVDRRTGGHWR